MVHNTFSFLASSCFQVFCFGKDHGILLHGWMPHAYATILENGNEYTPLI